MGIVTARYNKDDKPSEDLLSIFSSTCDLIEEKRVSGRKVLVHCRMGVSRSVTLVLAYCKSYVPASSFLRYANICATIDEANGL